MTLVEIEAQLASLTRAEKAEVLQRLALELANTWPGIERTPGVAGGDACIVRTRIPVWTLEQYRRLGWSEARILDNYPMLRAADLVHAWAYVDAHRDEIERAIRDNEVA
ncbi:MAG TPA: DUF433 domain-containing protein [Polyangia bacterium]|jgi:uncharacterized protein (DUF433 family)|nr:DUF433 domain-containing protein [Polyangia bacterium]